MRTTIALCLALSFAGPGCQSDHEPEAVRDMAVVSLRNGELASNPVWSWARNSSVDVSASELDAGKVERMIRTAVEQGLAAHGWRRGVPGDYRIAYVAALESPLDGASVSLMFGMDPGIATEFDGQTYARGTLILDVTRNGMSAPVWRGAVQMRADPGLSNKIRQQRIGRAVDLLLSDLTRR
jgi:hypothetical protein